MASSMSPDILYATWKHPRGFTELEFSGILIGTMVGIWIILWLLDYIQQKIIMWMEIQRKKSEMGRKIRRRREQKKRRMEEESVRMEEERKRMEEEMKRMEEERMRMEVERKKMEYDPENPFANIIQEEIIDWVKSVAG
ncbi:GRB10-interacting GYF protein 2-like isoform X1 [Hyla sarda]|uniref:GRB10-interacting GYF protein 2-like isoform X1 n=1 Tax=Hyla sarda TaxID=327740 RepID=UPI0024C32456|nr:GRB10-interacting GYF protein 2-like isoform X1 [Hyla sarda]